MTILLNKLAWNGLAISERERNILLRIARKNKKDSSFSRVPLFNKLRDSKLMMLATVIL